MLQNIKKNNQKGFTIIEVLIVLAIAGLIMLIVLAVPALQRNSRNTQIRNDAANVLGGVSDFVANNNGTAPNSIAPVAPGSSDIEIKGATGTPVTAKVRGGTTVTSATWSSSFSKPAGDIVVVFGAKCGTAGAAAQGPGRAYVALFTTEAGGADVAQCVES